MSDVIVGQGGHAVLAIVILYVMGIHRFLLQYTKRPTGAADVQDAGILKTLGKEGGGSDLSDLARSFLQFVPPTSDVALVAVILDLSAIFELMRSWSQATIVTSTSESTLVLLLATLVLVLHLTAWVASLRYRTPLTRRRNAISGITQLYLAVALLLTTVPTILSMIVLNGFRTGGGF